MFAFYNRVCYADTNRIYFVRKDKDIIYGIW